MNTSKTLLQILVEELPKRGGWPDGVDLIAQTPGSSVLSVKCGSGKKFSLMLDVVASDHRLADVTREQYETALAFIRQHEGAVIKSLRFDNGVLKCEYSQAHPLPQEATTRANDDRLEADLNECIGQPQEDMTLMTHFLLDEINDAGTSLRLDDAYEIAQHLISVGYRKQ